MALPLSSGNLQRLRFCTLESWVKRPCAPVVLPGALPDLAGLVLVYPLDIWLFIHLDR